MAKRETLRDGRDKPRVRLRNVAKSQPNDGREPCESWPSDVRERQTATAESTARQINVRDMAKTRLREGQEAMAEKQRVGPSMAEKAAKKPSNGRASAES